MAEITIKSCMSTGLDVEFDSVTSVEIPDDNEYRGGFGKIYKCLKINGKSPKQSQLIKLFFITDGNNINTIQKLQQKLKKKNEELVHSGESLLEMYPALLAIPQFSFEGVWNSEKVVGYSANNLSEKGFFDFKNILDDDNLYDDFYTVFKLEEKYIIAYQLIKALNFLSSLGYVHADIKDDAIFINTNKKTCALIDFDSGAVFDHRNASNEEPTTIGTIQDWLAPEILDQIGKNIQDLNEVRVNIFTDTWSVATALFCIFFEYHPFNFLNEITKKQFKSYFSKHKWPEVEKGNDMEQILGYYHKVLPKELKKAFEITFNEGYAKPVLRYTYEQWEQAFMSIHEPPEIVFFNPKTYEIEKKENITLSWEVSGANKVFLNGTDVTNLKEYSVSPTRNTEYELKAINAFGKEVCEKSIIITSDKPPKIIDFNYRIVNKIKNEFQLTWKIENAHRIFLYPEIGEVTQKENYKIKGIGTFVLKAESYFGAKTEKSIIVSGLFNPNPDDSLFTPSPPNNVFNNL